MFATDPAGYTETMQTPGDNPSDTTNANQFDDDGLPGIDPNYPPEHAWAAEDPTAVNATADTPDPLKNRMARESTVTHYEVESAQDSPTPAIIDDGGAIADGAQDTEKQHVADTGRGDPDAPLSAEEAALKVVDSP